MSSQSLGSYALPDIQCSIAGNRISGWTADGGIEFEAPPEGTIITGADGLSTFSRSGNRSQTVTITTQSTSRAHRILGQLMIDQRSQIPLTGFVFQMFDPHNGDRVNEQKAVFIQGPSLNKVAESSPVVYVLHLPSPRVTYGELIS